ncbi:MAG: hypothetical protein ACLP0J_21520 [Solirubrobacteraceae bacterium]
MTETSDRKVTGGDAAATDAKLTNHPLAHVFATVERSVNEMRTSELTSHELRQLARAHERGQNEVWANLRHPRPRPRGAR